MIDAITRERLVIHTEGTGGPYFMVAHEQLEAAANALRAREVPHWVDEDAISLDGEPAVAVVNLGRGADVPAVQRLLDLNNTVTGTRLTEVDLLPVAQSSVNDYRLSRDLPSTLSTCRNLFTPWVGCATLVGMAMATIGGAGIRYVDRGKGLPLVLLHGFPLDSRMWEVQIGELSSRCRVVAPDFRGFAKSASTDPFTTESLADDVHALLEQINGLPCVLAGLSMGGYVALAYACKYPTDLRGLVLVDTKAAGDDAQGKENRNQMIDLVRSSGSKAVADQMLPKMLAEDTPRNRPATAHALRAMMDACPPKTIENALVCLRDRPDQTQTLPSITVPTLIIVGESDSITPVSVAQSMQKQIPGAQLAVIKGAGHVSPMEQSTQVNQAMSRFLDRLSAQ